ncbi:hypothetical protein [Flammeovirga sp. SJP92]|uniref:hypothetical protein n=1 Tax=Flammeovirga sp. SJP92 TaxID=1775430 RepID=UPI0007880EC5|nr:hypothetical protein [Flammeovirga sp. SJP92]KXX67465.1 hypothetical protein AVL50_29480 [Flammeovirga sp. SJP92]
MKQLTLFILFFFATKFIFAQNDRSFKNGDIIRVENNIDIRNGKPDSSYFFNRTDSVFNYLEGGYKYKVQGFNVDSNEYKITAIPFKTLSENKSKKMVDRRPLYLDQQFYVSKNELEENATKIEDIPKLTIGILYLPFRIRPQGEWAFEQSFNIGATAAYHIGGHCYIQIGSQIGSTILTNSNTKKEISEDINMTTLSLVGGIMYEHNKAQFGLYFGFDLINNQEAYEWKYHKKPWFTLGIGYDIFKLSTKKVSN